MHTWDYQFIFNLVFGLGTVFVLVIVGWLAGSAAERAHYKSLIEREEALGDMVVTDLKSFPMGSDPAMRAMIVTGEVVIASDYLKTILAKFRKFFGGELRSYHSLMNRARREAILRTLEQAHGHGYNAICNLRVNMVDISGAATGGRMGMVVVLTSGTAYRIPS